MANLGSFQLQQYEKQIENSSLNPNYKIVIPVLYRGLTTDNLNYLKDSSGLIISSDYTETYLQSANQEGKDPLLINDFHSEKIFGENIWFSCVDFPLDMESYRKANTLEPFISTIAASPNTKNSEITYTKIFKGKTWCKYPYNSLKEHIYMYQKNIFGQITDNYATDDCYIEYRPDLHYSDSYIEVSDGTQIKYPGFIHFGSKYRLLKKAVFGLKQDYYIEKKIGTGSISISRDGILTVTDDDEAYYYYDVYVNNELVIPNKIKNYAKTDSVDIFNKYLKTGTNNVYVVLHNGNHSYERDEGDYYAYRIEQIYLDTKTSEYVNRQINNFYIPVPIMYVYKSTALPTVSYKKLDYNITAEYPSVTSIRFKFNSSEPASYYCNIIDSDGNNLGSFNTDNTTSFPITLSKPYPYYITVYSYAYTDTSRSTFLVTRFYCNKLATPVVTGYRFEADSYKISWQKVDSADYYNIYLNDTCIKTTKDLEYTVNNLIVNSQNTVKVEAIYENNSNYNSEMGVLTINATDVQKLAAPTIKETYIKTGKEVDKIKLSWNGINYAKSYNIELYVDSISQGIFGTTKSTEYEIPSSWASVNQYGTFQWYVRAIADNSTYDSDLSNEYKYERSTLSSPSSVSLSGSTVSWSKVDGADYYEIELKGNDVSHDLVEVTELSKNLYETVKNDNVTSDVTINIFAKSYNKYFYHASTNAQCPDYLKLIKLDKPIWNDDYYVNEHLYFTADTRGTTNLTVKNNIDGKESSFKIQNVSSPFEYSFPSGLNTFYLQTFSDKTNTNPIYFDSDASDDRAYGALGILTLGRKAGTLEWNDLGSGVSYEIYDNDESIISAIQNATSYTIPESKHTTGKHSYYVKASTTINGIPYERTSNTETVEVTQLSTPIVAWENGTSVLVWETNSNEEYTIETKQQSSYTIVQSNNKTGNYTMDYPNPGKYFIRVKAKSTVDTFAYMDSEYSVEKEYNVDKLDRPENLKRTSDLTTNISTFTWDPVENATGYAIYYNGQLNSTITGTSFSIKTDEGFHSLYVVAIGSTTPNPNPKYFNSDSSNVIEFGMLATPTIRLVNNNLEWDSINGASNYFIYNFNSLYDVSTSNSYDIDKSSEHNFSFTVKAQSTTENVDPSSLSNTINFEIQQLNDPMNLLLEDDILTWGKSTNADYYNIYLNDNKHAVTTNLSYNFEQTFKSIAGRNIIKVSANSNNEGYTDENGKSYYFLESPHNEYIQKIIEKQNRYNIVIDGENYSDIQLPFSLKRTANDVLDTATLTLGYIHRKEKFEPLTPATLVIYEESQPAYTCQMVVESDSVDEIAIGTNSVYAHHLNLIQKTLLMQQEILPNFSVSQPSTQRLIRSVINPQIPDDRQFINSDHYINKEYKGQYAKKVLLLTIYKDVKWLIYGLGNELNGNIYTNYMLGDKISLPILGKNIYAKKTDCNKESFGYPSIIYKIRKHSDTLLEDVDCPETQIKQVGKNNQPVSIEYTFNSTGSYDLIMEIPAMNFKTYTQKTYGKTKDGYDNAITEDCTLDFMMSSDLNETDNPSPDELKPYRVVWSGIEVSDGVKNINYMTVADVLKKIITIINPIDTKNDKPTYSIDQSILSMTSSIICPETSFTNGRSLYEVLTELGKLFNGKPKLIDNGVGETNVITFVINSENSDSDVQQNQFEDSSELQQEKAELNNYSSGYISNIRNMVSDDNWSVYPSVNDLWTTIKSNGDSSVVDISTASIILDKPIYKIKRLYVKNVGTYEGKNINEVFDLTNYVMERTLFNAQTSRDQTHLLVYSTGDNIIENIGQLSYAKESIQYELQKSFGLAPTTYVIEAILIDILKDAGYNDSNIKFNDVDDMLFKVEYYPYIDTVSYIESDKQPNMKHINYRNFNQDASVVSDTRFGISSLKQIKRLGASTIQKTYKTKNINYIPLIGFKIMVDQDYYYADEIIYNFNNKYIESVVNYSKNYNKISPSMKVNSEYREYEIPLDNIIQRTININEYCHIENSHTENYKDYPINSSLWITALQNSFNNVSMTRPSSFYVNCYSDDKFSQISYTTKDSDGNKQKEKVEGICLTAAYTNLISSVQFTASMKDNFSAGYDCSKKDSIDGGGERYIQKDVRYVSDNANQLPYLRITLADPTKDQIKHPYSSSIIRSLPSCRWISNPQSTLSNVFYSKPIDVRKDYREALNFNYQMHFIADKKSNVFIHKGLTKYLFRNYSVTTTSAQEGKIIVVGYNGDISEKVVFDVPKNNILGREITMTSDITNNYLKLDLTKIKSNGKYDGYVLLWEGTNEIILEVRNPLIKDETIKDPLYFNFTSNNTIYSK